MFTLSEISCIGNIKMSEEMGGFHKQIILKKGVICGNKSACCVWMINSTNLVENV